MRYYLFLIAFIFGTMACTKQSPQANVVVQTDSVRVDTARIVSFLYVGSVHTSTADYTDSMSVTKNYIDSTVAFVGASFIRLFPSPRLSVFSFYGDHQIDIISLKDDSISAVKTDKSNNVLLRFLGKKRP